LGSKRPLKELKLQFSLSASELKVAPKFRASCAAELSRRPRFLRYLARARSQKRHDANQNIGKELRLHRSAFNFSHCTTQAAISGIAGKRLTYRPANEAAHA
jgi:hypothetical protein